MGETRVPANTAIHLICAVFAATTSQCTLLEFCSVFFSLPLDYFSRASQKSPTCARCLLGAFCFHHIASISNVFITKHTFCRFYYFSYSPGTIFSGLFAVDSTDDIVTDIVVAICLPSHRNCTRSELCCAFLSGVLSNVQLSSVHGCVTSSLHHLRHHHSAHYKCIFRTVCVCATYV